jgi:hypothetical protein
MEAHFDDLGIAPYALAEEPYARFSAPVRGPAAEL